MGIGVSASEVGISAPLYRQVNPFQGTGGWPLSSGMTFPGPTRPFGMIRPGPDTAFGTSTNWSTIFDNMATSGYYYGHGRLKGFSQYRLSGTGLQEGGQHRLVPLELRALADEVRLPAINGGGDDDMACSREREFVGAKSGAECTTACFQKPCQKYGLPKCLKFQFQQLKPHAANHKN